jgi:hypothetical protein
VRKTWWRGIEGIEGRWNGKNRKAAEVASRCSPAMYPPPGTSPAG